MRTIRTSVCAALAVTLTSFAHAQLLQNGNFNTPLLSNGNSYEQFFNNYNLGGWNVYDLNNLSGSVSGPSVTLFNFATPWAPNGFDGNTQYIDIQGTGDNQLGISQTVDLTAGTKYNLTFEQNEASFGSSSVDVNVLDGSDNSVLAGGLTNFAVTNDPTQAWIQQSLTFTADSTGPFTVEFGNNYSDAGVLGYVNLSPASPVPEPFTMTLGIAGVGLAVRRKIRKAIPAN